MRSDSDIDEHLDTLKSACRQTRRYRDAIPVFHRIAVLNPDRKHEVAAELALVHSHLGERAKAVSLLESAYAQQRRLPAWRRSLAFCLVAEVAATVLRQPTLAQDCAALGRSTVAPVRRRRAQAQQPVLAELDLMLPEPEPAVTELVRPRLDPGRRDRRLAAPTVVHCRQSALPVHFRMLPWPESTVAPTV